MRGLLGVVRGRMASRILIPDTWPLTSVPCSLRVVESDQVSEGHLVDALALRGDEGRDRLR